MQHKTKKFYSILVLLCKYLHMLKARYIYMRCEITYDIKIFFLRYQNHVSFYLNKKKKIFQ